MNVKELIEKLREFPLQAEVMVADWNEDFSPPIPLETMVFKKDAMEVVLEEHEQ